MGSNIWTQYPFVYASTVSGVKVYDLDSENLLNFIEYDGTRGVWADDSYMYMATSNSGIYRCDVTTMSGGPILEVYKQYPDITNNNVCYIHGNNNYLCIVTISGIDHYDITTDNKVYTTISGVSKCYQTARGEFYYTYNAPTTDSELHVVYDNLNDWDRNDLIFPVGHIYEFTDRNINDLHVTEKTSRYDEGNLLLLATSNGAVVMEEKPGDEENNNYKYYMLDT